MDECKQLSTVLVATLFVTKLIFAAASWNNRRCHRLPPVVKALKAPSLILIFLNPNFLLLIFLLMFSPLSSKTCRVFHGIDKNNDKYISPAELRVLIIGIKLEDDGFIRGDYADKVREAFDISGDSNIDEEEFVAGLSKFLVESKQTATHDDQKVPNTSTEEGQSLLVEKTNATSSDNPWKNYIKVAYLILLGTVISVLLARPLIQSVVGVATATSIPPFFIPYVVIPLTLSFRSAGRTITSARQKTVNSVSLTLAQIYGTG